MDRRGLVHETDAANVVAMKKLIDRFTMTDVALDSKASASNVREGFEATNVNDDDAATYWATEGGVTTATIELKFDRERLIWGIDIAEHIQLGQRHSFIYCGSKHKQRVGGNCKWYDSWK